VLDGGRESPSSSPGRREGREGLTLIGSAGAGAGAASGGGGGGWGAIYYDRVFDGLNVAAPRDPSNPRPESPTNYDPTKLSYEQAPESLEAGADEDQAQVALDRRDLARLKLRCHSNGILTTF